MVWSCGNFGGTAQFLFILKRKSYKELGGITGDTAGFFVTVCEVATAVRLRWLDIYCNLENRSLQNGRKKECNYISEDMRRANLPMCRKS